MEQITPSISQIEELLQQFEVQYEEKTNMPLDWVSQYKTFQSHNITLENWNTINLYIQNVLSDSKSSYEFIVNSMNILFDTLSLLESNDQNLHTQLNNLQAYIDLYSDIFTKGVIYVSGATIGAEAPSSLVEGQVVMSISSKTSQYVGGVEVTSVQLLKVVNRVYTALYTDDSVYHDLVIKHSNSITNLSLEVTSLKAKLDSIDVSQLVYKNELNAVAFSGDYTDLLNKPTIPTQLSQLENDTAFITNAVSDLINYYKKDETLSKEEILEKIAAIETIRFEVYASLDEIETPKSNVIYLIGTESPYKEYIYVESIGFEEIGKLEIDLSNYVQSDNVLSSGNLVVGSGEKKVVDSGVSLDITGLSNSANKIPTSFIVSRAIAQYHEVATINGDSGTIALTNILSKYRLIVDENLLVYRRVLSETNKIVYHAKYLVDSTHTRDYFLTLTAVDGLNYNYVRTYIENVSHTEFDTLVSNTPTDLTYDSESGKMQLVHDGNAIGSGIVLESGAFTPYFDNSGLVLSDLNTLDSEVITSIQNTTYAELLNKVKTSGLKAGQLYRITDYTTTTTQENTRSAGHQFDIIVIANSVNTLNENAYAIQHDGDTYFANSKLNAWQIKYDFNNDTTRFVWADTTNGKGVIYYMKDEYENECFYDFKNIQFIRKLTEGALDLENGTDTWCYTFGGEIDRSIPQDALHTFNSNYVGPRYQGCEEAYWIPDNVFLGGNNECMSKSNILKQNCYNNTFGYKSQSNTFGNDCNSNTIGNECNKNTFGNECSSNTFGHYIQYIECSNKNSYISLNVSDTGSNFNYVKYVKLDVGLIGTSANRIEINASRNLSHWVVYKSADTTEIEV